MKGLFIPEITAEMFRNGCLEGIEALMAEGEIYDIDYTGWIPVSERLPKELEEVLVCVTHNGKSKMAVSCRRDYNYWDSLGRDIIGEMAWMPLPEPYKGDDTEWT